MPARARPGTKLRIEGFVSNVTGEVHEAAQIIAQFDNTRFCTCPRLAGVRLRYRRQLTGVVTARRVGFSESFPLRNVSGMVQVCIDIDFGVGIDRDFPDQP